MLTTPGSQAVATTDGNAASNNKLLSDFFTCAICQDVMSHPYCILECLHRFDRECLIECWKTSSCCPLCKTPSTKASHDFVLQGMIESTRPQGSTQATTVDNASIFPSPVLNLGPSRGFASDPFGEMSSSQMPQWEDEDEDEDEEMTQDESEDVTARISFLPAHEPLCPGGNLIFPCDSCTPGNITDYECQWPISMPTEEQINMETQRTGRMIRAPGANELRAPLAQANVWGCMSHLQCESCTVYVPREYPANIRCTLCRLVYCGEYTRKPNCGGISLHPMDALVYKNNSVQEIVRDSFPEFVRMNREEIHRFEQHLITQNISIAMILRQLVEAREAAYEPDDDDQFGVHSQGAAKENPWANAVLCTTCIDALVRVHAGVWNWWLQERARGPVDPALRALPDCWYGWECRTQAKSFPQPTHASKFNHICPRIK
ncbi:hypothetical protein M408DRAFT_325567 [Serendipita vermifera MAFF 305830]|uniref:RING-type domain-containing protein n=1 Tax=Serendipita vermifera MAFF 305830 TaxID=933852 RepID=A0A0C3BB43_SERVB|nr:hypothetical protein M408DRAFT_325567 [Serendipita vermifera MAFF 305830]